MKSNLATVRLHTQMPFKTSNVYRGYWGEFMIERYGVVYSVSLNTPRADQITVACLRSGLLRWADEEYPYVFDTRCL
jgi:hypothetical protein